MSVMGAQKRNIKYSVISVICILTFDDISRHRDGGGTDRMVQDAFLGKIFDRDVFGGDLIKMKQATKSIRSKALSKEEDDFHLLIALSFHDLSRKKKDTMIQISEKDAYEDLILYINTNS